MYGLCWGEGDSSNWTTFTSLPVWSQVRCNLDYSQFIFINVLKYCEEWTKTTLFSLLKTSYHKSVCTSRINYQDIYLGKSLFQTKIFRWGDILIFSRLKFDRTIKSKLKSLLREIWLLNKHIILPHCDCIWVRRTHYSITSRHFCPGPFCFFCVYNVIRKLGRGYNLWLKQFNTSIKMWLTFVKCYLWSPSACMDLTYDMYFCIHWTRIINYKTEIIVCIIDLPFYIQINNFTW